MGLTPNDGLVQKINFSLLDSEINSAHPLINHIRNQVLTGAVIILKEVFPENVMIAFKKEIIKWAQETSPFAHGESPAKYPELNYHRIDDGSIPSACPHIFHQYGFNNIGNLSLDTAALFTNISERLLLIQNAVAETKYDISLKGLRLKVLQYPEGGGFLAEHTHPKEPQHVGLILSLSKKGVDFSEGAAAFSTPMGHVNTVNYHDIGDVIIFRYDLPHSVTPVNPQNTAIDWTSTTGKWSVVLELRETHGLSHKNK